MAEQTREILFKFTASATDIQKELTKTTKILNDQRAELSQLNSDYKAAQKVVNDYASQQDALTKELVAGNLSQKEYDKQLSALNDEYKKAQNTLSTYAQSQSRLKKEINDLSKEQRQQIRDLQNVNRVTDSAEGSNDQLKGSIALLTKEYDKLSAAERENTQRGRELTRVLADQRQALIDNKAQINDNRLNVGNYASAFDGLTGGISGTIGSLIGPGGLVAGVGLAAQVIGDGIKAVIEIERRFTSLRGEVQRLTGEIGPALDEAVIKIESVAQTFGKDFNDVLISSNSLAKQLGISTNEAIDLIERGFLAGADQSGEFLSILEEYPAQLQAVGLDAETAISIISQQVKSGIFSDKGVDTIKEAGLRLRELPKATREAIDGIGLSSDEIEQALKSGEKGIFEVIQEISKQLSTLPPQSAAVGVAIADIFGGPGEDAGLQYITTLQTVEDDLNALIDPTNTLTQLQQEQLKVNKELAAAQNELSKVFSGTGGEIDTLVAQGKIFLIEVLLEVIKEIKRVINVFQPLFTLLGKIADAFGFLGDKINDVREFFGFARTEFSLFDTAVKLVARVITGPFATAIRVFETAYDLIQAFIGLFLDGVNKIKELSNEFLGTDFDISVNVNTEPAELTLEGLQASINNLQPPPPVPIDLDAQNAKKQAAALSDTLSAEEKKKREEEEKEREKARKKQEQAAKQQAARLKVLQKQQIEDQIAGIELQLISVEKGSQKELALRKELLFKQRDLALATREQTANQELLLIKETNVKVLQTENQFQSERLQISVNGLEKTRELLTLKVGAELAANAQIKADAVLTSEQAQKTIQATTQADFEAAKRREAIAELLKTQQSEFSEQSKLKQIEDLKKLVENEKLTAEEREQVSKQLAQTQLSVASDSLNAIAQLNQALGAIQQAQKERELEQAAGNAQKEEEINLKFARKEKNTALRQSVINTALAVVQALPNIPLSILVGAIGAVNTGIIASQSFADGGFTGSGFTPDRKEPGRKIAGVVHDNEFVVTTKSLKNEKIRNVVTQIDRYQKGRIPGFADGGFTTPFFSDGGVSLDQANQQFNNQELGNIISRAIGKIEVVATIEEINKVGNRVKIKEQQSAV